MAGTDKAILVNAGETGSLFSTGFLQWRPPIAPETLGPWIFYAVQSPDFLQKRDLLASGTTQTALNDGNLSKITIRLAPLAEQRRIVEAIETRFTRLVAAVKSLERVRANLKRYRASVLYVAFRNDESNLRALGSLVRPNRPICYGILKPQMEGEGDVPYVEVKDLKRTKILVGNLNRTTQHLHQMYARSALKTGDVLMAVRGSWGRTGVVSPELEGGNVSRDVARISPGSELNPAFLRYYLLSRDAQTFLAKHARGVAVKGVNIGDLRRLPLPVPDLTVQEKVVGEIERRLSVADEVASEVTASHRRCARLRESILQMAFDGRLVPQDPTDEPARLLLERISQERPQSEAPNRRARARSSTA